MRLLFNLDANDYTFGSSTCIRPSSRAIIFPGGRIEVDEKPQ